MHNKRLAPLTLALLYAFTPIVRADEPQTPATASASANSALPVNIVADKIKGSQKDTISAEGNVMLKQDDNILTAPRIDYTPSSGLVSAPQAICLQNSNILVNGKKLLFNITPQTGSLYDATYALKQVKGRGNAKEIDFLGPNLYRLHQAQYTTCQEGNNDWYLNVHTLDLDRTTETGIAHGSTLIFKGYPIAWLPWIDFPLSNQRKSGVLTPSFGSSANNGFDIRVPYYFNIAPNLDDTFAARILTKRGIQLQNEFRYLEPDFSGKLNVEYLPHDRLASRERYAIFFQHQQNFGHGLTGNLDYQRVSDSSYFSDLSTYLANTALLTLPQQASLNYRFGNWNLQAQTQQFQTLQDPSAPIIPPYGHHQIAFSGSQDLKGGAEFKLNTDITHFFNPNRLDGDRFIIYPSLSYPIQRSYGYITPKIGYHFTRYHLNSTSITPLDLELNNNLPISTDSTRALPIMSVDSGLYLDRPTTLFNHSYTQTLEPRLYYLYIPYRDQNNIPVFDSALADFSFTQMFSENRFLGNDRINNANQLTAAVTSKLNDPESGDTRLYGSIGQRFNFTPQKVFLPNEPPDLSGTSDLLGAAGFTLNEHWSIDGAVDYNTSQNTNQNNSLMVSYQPRSGEVINFRYRYSRDFLEQIDLSSQWPIHGNWYLLARWDYSLRDRRILEGLAGLEYNGGCWQFRSVIHHLVTGVATASNAFFLQLEFDGLGQLGTNPLDVLKRNISGYEDTSQLDSNLP
ncbi:MAG TPA: LPS-assembly protein LptD [Burkholderiales bacterium]|nr:LPS-assembly protein LptD [Burkholderiales bacterium]